MSYYDNGLDGGCSGCMSCLLVLILIIGFDFLLGWLFMLLWNWLAPLFWEAAPILTYWQSFGVVMILSLIGSFFKNSSSN